MDCITFVIFSFGAVVGAVVGDLSARRNIREGQRTYKRGFFITSFCFAFTFGSLAVWLLYSFIWLAAKVPI